MTETPRTLLEAARYFADRAVCEQYMKDLRWKGGKPVCPAWSGGCGRKDSGRNLIQYLREQAGSRPAGQSQTDPGNGGSVGVTGLLFWGRIMPAPLGKERRWK